MIAVKNFNKSYNGLAAIRDLTFTVEPGQIVGLVGPNGAGKTTLLRTLAGIIPPTSGSLSVMGHNIVNDSVRAKGNLGFIPDEPHLFDNLTVWEHLAFFAAVYGISDFGPSAEKLLTYFDLKAKKDHVVQSLSRGMRQKVAIACAYLHEPSVLLFDEPLTGLDPEGIRSIRTSLRELAANGTAVIVSSHLLDLVESICTHLLILHQGRLQSFGPMGEVLKAFSQIQQNSKLEDVFFAITEGDRE